MKEQHDDKKYIVLAVLVSFEKDITKTSLNMDGKYEFIYHHL